ncbi:fructosamine kinase family protein [Atopobiaceae bacterium Sow4_H2]
MGIGFDDNATIEKNATSDAEDLLGEAAGLAWLGEAEATGGLRAASVLSASKTRLVEKRITTKYAPTASDARAAGTALARTHAAGAQWLGCPPPGWEAALAADAAGHKRMAYVVHGALTPVVPRDDAPSSWGAFFAEWRVMPFVRTLVDTRELSFDDASPLLRVCDRLADSDFDAPQPALVESAIADSQERAAGSSNAVDTTAAAPFSPVTCARLHGDLWAGNLLWDADPTNATHATLIDPMAHGGHAETDLAMLRLFGCDRLDDLIRGYDEASPLADGWRERVGLHQLAPLLLHCVIYGGYFLGETLRVATRYI